MSKKIWDVKELSKKMLSFNDLKGKSSPETMAQNCEEGWAWLHWWIHPKTQWCQWRISLGWYIIRYIYIQHRVSCLKNRYASFKPPSLKGQICSTKHFDWQPPVNKWDLANGAIETWDDLALVFFTVGLFLTWDTPDIPCGHGNEVSLQPIHILRQSQISGLLAIVLSDLRPLLAAYRLLCCSPYSSDVYQMRCPTETGQKPTEMPNLDMGMGQNLVPL